MFPPVTRGKRCPRCGHRTQRNHTPFRLRPVRWLFPVLTWRQCHEPNCRWHGFALPERQAIERA
jgi:hypothetical protein